ncbi:MAG: exo-beta-1,3-glucanase (GH17 family) [Myxococcota bacterium]|jgi:exo-beta-1,3-glucanase (GH17 family)
MKTIMMFCVLALTLSCASSGPVPAPEASGPLGEAVTDAPVAASARTPRRDFPLTVDGKPLLNGISYGPFRKGQKPGGPNPTRAQIVEDLKIIAERWQMIRVYDALEPTETIVKAVRDEAIPLKVMLGVWLDRKDPGVNAHRVREAIRIANTYPDQIIAVSVGNESQVYWSGHRIPAAALLGPLKEVRAAISQPVTTADDYNFWNRPESQRVAEHVDFLLLHAYAMWNKQPLNHAVGWTGGVVDAIQGHHPDLTIVIGETGWATELNPEGEERKYIKAPTGEAEQARFFKDLTSYLTTRGIPYFYFSAFDEPWKGSADPREVEKHWGLYNVDRTPKRALNDAPGE